MAGLIIILISFVVAGVVRVILKKKENCPLAKTIPQLIMIGGGLIGAYVFMAGNWSS